MNRAEFKKICPQERVQMIYAIAGGQFMGGDDDNLKKYENCIWKLMNDGVPYEHIKLVFETFFEDFHTV